MNTTRSSLSLALVTTLACATAALAGTVSWTGTGSDQNWSTGANWNPTTPPTSADDVTFFDSNATSPTINSAFAGGTIGSLRFGSTNTDYTLTVAPGVTLTLTGSGLRVGTPGDTGTAVSRTVTFTGSGGSLSLNNPTATLALNQGTATSANGSRAILNLEGLDSFTANVGGIGLGSVNYPNTVAQRNSGTLYLARTNLITLSYAQPLSVYMTNAAATNALEMVHAGSGNPPGALSFLYLGQTNAFFLDSLGIGRSKSSLSSAATIQFNPSFPGAYAYFRGVGGPNSRVTWWAIGDMGPYASSAQHAVGTNNFVGGTVDALVDTMSLGRDTVQNHTASGSGRINTGVLLFDNGLIDVNNLLVGNQSLAQAGSTSVTPNQGHVILSGPNATLVVNNLLTLANTTISNTGALQTYGAITVDGGTLRANTIVVGPNSVTNALIKVLNSGRLVLSNSLAASSKPLRTLSLSDSTFVVHLTGATPIATVTNLFTSGTTNTIAVGSSILFPTYPAQVALFKFNTISNDVSGVGTHNFVIGSVPSNVVGAYLSNNTFNSSLDLCIPTDPRPIVTELPGSFSGSPGANVTFHVGVAGVAPFTYQWRVDGTDVADGNGISGAKTETLAINNAQPTHNGNYSVVITNAYGSTTSSPPAVLKISSGDIAPIITGPFNLAVVQGSDATFTATVAGTPTPALQWRKNGTDIPGANGLSYTVVQAQYPADEATYSIIATNVAGKTTNTATLTVLVSPVIVTQPTSSTVAQGSPVSFSVVATGHPSLNYHWSLNSNPISGATNATYSIPTASPADAGTYVVLISNGGGATNSVPATLTVTSTSLSYTNLSPSNGASGVGYDTPLHLKFDTTPVLGAGTLRIYDAAGTLADTIDLGLNDANKVQPRTIAAGTYNTFPVIIHGNTAAVFPHLGILTSNTTYYVLMDPGFFKDAGGASHVGITSPATWRFTTKTVGPDPFAVTNVVVAADGSGDFVTVQGAIDWVPDGNAIPMQILLRKGTYEEINRVPAGKNNITFVGEGYQESIIMYANNNSLQGSLAGTGTRIMFYAGGNDLVFKNLTLTNSTPAGGSQAEALRINGMRAIVDNCRLCSYQDTLLVNTAATSTLMANKTLIQGQTDFIWGAGVGYFQSCEIKALLNGQNTQPRTAPTTYGFIFADCTLSRAGTNVTTHYLARDGGNSYPNGAAAYLNCKMDAHVAPVGWNDGGLTDKSSLRFWEYRSSDLTGTNLINTSSRASWSRQLTASDPEVADMRNLTNVFGFIGWVPQLPPYIAYQPTTASALVGQALTVVLNVGGVPEPVYRWYKESNPVPGATNSTLVIPNVQASDSGNYSLRVTNDYGYAISSNIVVSVATGVRPTLSNPTRLPNGSFQFSFSGGAGQAYRIWATPNLSSTPILTTWSLLGSGTFDTTPVTFVDAQATNFLQRFYIITVP